jgi:hypothetical protein
VVFVFYPETGYRLAAVYIECPHGYAIFSGNTGEEAGKRLGVIIIFYNKLAFSVKVVFRFFINYLGHVEIFYLI